MLCIIIGTRPQILKCFSLIEELKKKKYKIYFSSYTATL